MSEPPAKAVAIAGQTVRITKTKITMDWMPCPNPKCKSQLEVTNLTPLNAIRCSKCENVTWLPAYVPKWWQKGWAVLSILGTGVVVGLIVDWLVGWMGSLE